ncbi:MAG: D-alanine--D-alanine ligase, partial [Halobacteria archaeon]|nr:D-alanine--D-alanine ligase [Halobacteria archaeon]
FGKVAVLMGGWSAERTISLNSGQAVLDALRRGGVDAHGVDVQRETVLQELAQGLFARAFVMLHGPGGEDGVIQGALEVLGLPYTGSAVMASALAMDKLRSKQLLEGAGIPTPPYLVLDDDFDPDYVVATLGLPLMVKPALEGSSIGMSKVDEVEELPAARHEAARFRGKVLAERWIEGREYTVAMLGDTPLPVICLETPRDFYDYEAKYQANDTRYLCPCGLPAAEEQRLQRLALAAFQALGAEGWGRVDIMCTQDGTPFVIELNTVPGMTDHSLVPMAAKAAGIDFDQLVLRILAQTLDLNQEDSHVRAG